MFDISSEDTLTLGRIRNVDWWLNGKFQVWRNEVLENYNMAAGHIYRANDLQKLIAEGRPSDEYNLFAPMLMQVLGGFKQAMPGISLRPQSITDEQYVHLFEALNNWILYQANSIDNEIAHSFMDALIARIGWLRQDWFSDENFPDGYVRIRRVNPMNMVWDTDFTNSNLEDCNYLEEFRFLGPEEIVATYAQNNPIMAKEIFSRAKMILSSSTSSKQEISTWAERALQESTSYLGEKRPSNVDDSSYTYTRNFLDYINGKLKVIDFYERRAQKVLYLIRPDGSTMDITKQVAKNGKNKIGADDQDWVDGDKLQLIRDRVQENTGLLPSTREAVIQKIWQTTAVPIINMILSDTEQDFQNYNFRYTPIMCYDFSTNMMEVKSMVDNTKGIVRSINYRRNTMLTMLQKNSQGGYVAEESALGDHLEEWKRNDIAPIKLVKDGMIGKVEPQQGPNFPSALDKYADEEGELLKMISGVTDSARGVLGGSGESGELFKARVAQSDMMQTWISDNAQRALVAITKNNLSFIQKYFTEQRTIRLERDNVSVPDTMEGVTPGSDQTYAFLSTNQSVDMGPIQMILNDTSKGKFNVVISARPFGQVAKENEFNKLLQMVMFLAKAFGPSAIPVELLIKNAPIIDRSELLDYMKKVMSGPGQAGQPAQQTPPGQAPLPSGPTTPGMAQQTLQSGEQPLQAQIQQLLEQAVAAQQPTGPVSPGTLPQPNIGNLQSAQ